MSVLIFLGVLFVLVLVHELGHFMTAKWMGMRVDEFGIGFPPKIFGIKRGETLYSFNIFPIGGFVKIFGEDGVGDPSARLSENISEQGERNSPLSGQSRYGKDGTSHDKTDTATSSISGSFTSKSKWAQSLVLLAGITMNILFAWLLIAIAFGIGVDSSVSEKDASSEARLTITSVLPDSPAGKAELLPGVVIKGVQSNEDSLESFTPSGFSAFVESHKDSPLTILYTHKGEPRMVQLNSEAGIITDSPERHAIGVALAQVDTVQRSFGESVTDSFMYTVSSLEGIALGLGSLLYDTVRFDADFSQLAGPVGIVGLVGEASAYGITALLMFTAFISLNLAVINVLPFPALDGGRLLFVIIEAIKGSPLNERYVATLNTAGFFLLIALMVAVTWNDIARLI